MSRISNNDIYENPQIGSRLNKIRKMLKIDKRFYRTIQYIYFKISLIVFKMSASNSSNNVLSNDDSVKGVSPQQMKKNKELAKERIKKEKEDAKAAKLKEKEDAKEDAKAAKLKEKEDAKEDAKAARLKEKEDAKAAKLKEKEDAKEDAKAAKLAAKLKEKEDVKAAKLKEKEDAIDEKDSTHDHNNNEEGVMPDDNVSQFMQQFKHLYSENETDISSNLSLDDHDDEINKFITFYLFTISLNSNNPDYTHTLHHFKWKPLLHTFHKQYSLINQFFKDDILRLKHNNNENNNENNDIVQLLVQKANEKNNDIDIDVKLHIINGQKLLIDHMQVCYNFYNHKPIGKLINNQMCPL